MNHVSVHKWVFEFQAQVVLLGEGRVDGKLTWNGDAITLGALLHAVVYV